MEFPKGLTERSLKKGQFTKEWGELREPKKTAEKQETRTTLDLKGESVFKMVLPKPVRATRPGGESA